MSYTCWPLNSLCEFTGQWNHHGIRILGHQTTLAMWYTRLLTAPEESIAANWQTYGIDYDGLLTDIETDNNVVVPESHIQLTDQQLQELQNRIDPLFDDGNNGNNHFLRHCDNHGRFHKAVMRNMFQLLNKSIIERRFFFSFTLIVTIFIINCTDY